MHILVFFKILQLRLKYIFLSLTHMTSQIYVLSKLCREVSVNRTPSGPSLVSCFKEGVPLNIGWLRMQKMS